MKKRILDLASFDSVLDRFSRFSDGMVRRLSLNWDPSNPRACIEIEAMDKDRGWEWVDVCFDLSGLRKAYWASDWRGSIECGELIVRRCDDNIVLAVGGQAEGYRSLEDFNEQSSSMFFVGTTLEMEVTDVSSSND